MVIRETGVSPPKLIGDTELLLVVRNPEKLIERNIQRITDYGNAADIRTAAACLPRADSILPDGDEGAEFFLAHFFAAAILPDQLSEGNAGSIQHISILQFLSSHNASLLCGNIIAQLYC